MVLLTTSFVGCKPESLDTVRHQQEWTLSEVNRIGTLDEPGTSLTRITDALLAADGTLLVLQPVENMIRVFTPDGAPRTIIGRRGGGPGEFTSLKSFGWHEDGLYAVDISTGRISLFDVSGKLIEDWSPSLQVPEDQTFPPVAWSMLSEGRILVNARQAMRARVDGTGVPERFFVTDLDGAVRSDGFELSTINSRFAIRNPNNPFTGYFDSQPLTDDPLLATHPAGEFIVIVERGVGGVEAGDSAGVRIHRIVPHGDTAWTRTLAVPAVAISRASRDSIVDPIIERVRGARGPGLNPAQLEAALMEVLYQPDVYPPVERVMVGYEGHVWLEMKTMEDRPSGWLVLDEQGRTVARASGAPDGTELLDHRGGQAVGVMTDELDVPYLVRFEINIGDAGGG